MSTITVEKVEVRPGTALLARVLTRGALALASLWLFVLALELVKRGASSLAPLLRAVDVTDMTGAMGLGWLMACLVLSGSPVAAIALALLAGGSLAPDGCFSMIVGSRLGASFVVLLVGALDDFRGRRTEKRSAYVGVTALVTTAVTYLPAMALGLHGLRAGWLSWLHLEGRVLASLLSSVYGPIVTTAAGALPPVALFGLGVAVLLLAFRTIDSALPDAARQQQRLLRARDLLERPWFLFAAGLAVTAVTMSVSMSLSILVPLAAKGYLRRESLWAYVLGANITTFDDTLFAAALIGHPDAVRLVALLASAVTLLSMPLVFLLPRAFGGLIDRIAARATRDGSALLWFVLLLLSIPTLLVAL